jgi:hypothetical protein
MLTERYDHDQDRLSIQFSTTRGRCGRAREGAALVLRTSLRA